MLYFDDSVWYPQSKEYILMLENICEFQLL